jgi:fructosamine-3-kinase
MWQTVVKDISVSLAIDFSLDNKQALTGGDTHLSYKINGAGRTFFVKVAAKEALMQFEAESFSLTHLQQFSHCKIPKVICSGLSLDKSFLVLEYLNFQPPTSELWAELGKQLAKQHQQADSGEYGWDHDNFIGNNIQVNRWHKSWSRFFAEQRIGWQLQLLKEKGHWQGNTEKVVGRIQKLLANHQPRPCLLHGDLWQGNIGFYQDQPAIFDPACYFGDREADLAMTELFGRFDPHFYQGYQEQYPLDKGYEGRKGIYNLYHLLNHSNLFGGVYIDQAQNHLEQLLDFKHD